MYQKYEEECKRLGLDEDTIRKIRNAADYGRKNLAYQNERMKEENITIFSVSAISDLQGNDRKSVFSIPDSTVDVEEEAVKNAMISLMMEKNYEKMRMAMGVEDNE